MAGVTCSDCGTELSGDPSTTKVLLGKPFCVRCFNLTSVASPASTREDGGRGEGLVAMSVLFLLGGIGLAVWGVVVSLREEEIVGGDAYNFIIAGVRGTAIAASGIVAACTGVIFAVLSLRAKTR